MKICEDASIKKKKFDLVNLKKHHLFVIFIFLLLKTRWRRRRVIILSGLSVYIEKMHIYQWAKRETLCILYSRRRGDKLLMLQQIFCGRLEIFGSPTLSLSDALLRQSFWFISLGVVARSLSFSTTCFRCYNKEHAHERLIRQMAMD